MTKVKNVDNKTEKKGGNVKAQRDNALQFRINIRTARLRAHGLTQQTLAGFFNCCVAMVNKAITEDRQSEKAKSILAFIDNLEFPTEGDPHA